MCGIAGILSYQKNFNIPRWLHSASQLLQHRGNDDDGITLFSNNTSYCSKISHPLSHHPTLPYLQHTPYPDIPTTDFHLGLLHRRLSILDLSEYGHQPMCNEDASVWITYNGEIYNYKRLRNTLEQTGFHFFSNTDTEVVLKAYLHYGKNFVRYLNGMWAFCIYDTQTKELFLSRDRIGVKPLYYVYSQDLFAFASEQKVFLKTGLIPFEINQKALSKYLLDNVLEYEEEGIFRHIKELQPGENLIVNINNLQIKKEKYFLLENLLSTTEAQDEQSIIYNTKNVVSTSICEHLQSDVPVAVALSGGIDSSVIASIAAQYTGQLHTFSIVYPQNTSIDESPFITELNKKPGSIPHLITPTPENFFQDIDELLYSQDIPIWSTSTYNQFLLMKEVKKNNIKVILSGQGSDELFAGYQHHYVAYWFSLLKKFQLKNLLLHLSKSNSFLSNSYSLFVKSIIKNFYPHQRILSSKFISRDILRQYPDDKDHWIHSDLNTELIRDLSYRRLKAFLKCEDRCSMWHSVESRLPFSDDITLLKYAFQIPAHLKLKNGTSKYVLREAFKNELPKSIYERKDKKGFDAPLKEWLLLKEKDILHEIKTNALDIINIRTLNKINTFKELSDHETKILFKLFLMSRWKKIWK
ncbi:MAG: asparagine synthetase B [Bacteroidia bacterium]|nr:MAG: asparagine synthetase B [Bacteroidia bacterium]